MVAVPPEQKMLAQEVYDRILRTSNYFLHNTKHFSVGLLKAETPSYAELAGIMKKLAIFVGVLAEDFDPMMGQKAFEYCELMHRIAVAIEKEDQIELECLVAELDRRPGV